MLFVIKHFDNNTPCEDRTALLTALKTRYANNSVSIVRKSPSGIDKVTFVDVDEQGNTSDAYTGTPVDFS